MKNDSILEDLKTTMLTDIRVPSTGVSPNRERNVSEKDHSSAEDGKNPQQEILDIKLTKHHAVIDVEPSSILEFEMFEQECMEEEDEDDAPKNNS
jgi:hypothetical protein